MKHTRKTKTALSAITLSAATIPLLLTNAGAATVPEPPVALNCLTGAGSVVTPGNEPFAADDTAITTPGVNITTHVLCNDVPTKGAKFDPTSLHIITAGASNGGTTFTTPNAIYTVDTTNGVISAEPLGKFIGEDLPVVYQVKDTAGNTTYGNLTLTVKPSILGTLPKTVTATTTTNHPVTVDVLNNAKSGSSPFMVDSMKFVTTTAGTWSVDVSHGKETFTPRRGFTGVAKTSYTVKDVEGHLYTGVVAITVKNSSNTIKTLVSPLTGKTSSSTVKKTGVEKPTTVTGPLVQTDYVSS